MSLKEELLTAVKPFLMKEGLESSKEIIATNSTSFDEMGMANSKPGEFSQEEITDPENLVNVSKMSNDNNFNTDSEESETIVSILGITDDTPEHDLGDLVNLGTGASCECEDDMRSKECHSHHHDLASTIEHILRKKDKAFLESLNEADLNEEDLEEIVNYWPGFTQDKPDKGKYATHLASRLRNSIGDITSGKTQVPDDIRKNFADKNLVADWKQYNNSNRGDPEYKKAVIAAAVELAPGNEEAQKELIHNPTEEMCASLAARLNKKLGNGAIEFNLVPGEDLLDKYSQNYQAGRRAFTNAYLNSFEGKWQQDVLSKFHNYLNGNAEAPVAAEPAAPAMDPEDVALLQKAGISVDNPEAAQILAILKQMNKKPAAAKKKGKLAQALESVLAESDYAGNLSYNPDKRLNASDILNAVKNAVKPELAPALSVVKNVDANEEPSYAIQNIDEKELPEKLEIDTNTDKKVVLKKDGNSYKFDKE